MAAYATTLCILYVVLFAMSILIITDIYLNLLSLLASILQPGGSEFDFSSLGTMVILNQVISNM